MSKCHDCGHEHPTMAMATRGGDTRYFCHENGHSCYHDRYGNYWGDKPASPREFIEAAMKQHKERNGYGV